MIVYSGKLILANSWYFTYLKAYLGLNIGPILSYIITGYLSSSWVGWPASFYLFGAIGLGWCVLYYFLAHNSPASHPSISDEELRYIEASLEQKSGEDEEVSLKV